MDHNLTSEDASANDYCTVDYVAYILVYCMTVYFYGHLKGTPEYTLYMNWGMTVISFAWLRGSNVHFNLRGMQSGHPLTSILNSVFHYFCRKFIFAGLYPNASFKKEIKYSGHGDDAGTSVPPEFPEYNMQTVGRHFIDLFGMQLTDSSKNPAVTGYLEDKSEYEFLSRKFDILTYKGQDYMVHKLKQDSLFGCLNYIRTDELSEFDAMQANIRVTQMEALYHGRDFFDKLTNELIVLGSKSKYIFTIENYDYFASRFANNYYKTDSPVLGGKYDPMMFSL